MSAERRAARAPSIVRYVVERMTPDGQWHQESWHRKKTIAEARAALRSEAFRVTAIELVLNARLTALGIAKAERLIDALGRNHIEAVGTAEELLRAGLAEPYMLDGLDERSGTRYGVDEFGVPYIATRGGKRGKPHCGKRYRVTRRRDAVEPLIPHGNCRAMRALVDVRTPEDVDVAPLLERFRLPAKGGAG